ncbi:MAG: nicotinate-nucleotide--dimethylbenzimidazole phosphoribosyltransferase [Clostridia bacterium]|nr:nicotinate-nucleotide--dimethylbenzimidazole phosphoribosyltransferase [Clostridia bacterium]
MSIKAFLGPWPRALEAAGLKEPRGDDRLQKNREKRARAKKRLREAKKSAKAAAQKKDAEEILNTLIQSVGVLDQNAMQEAERRQAELAKPPGSLGRLETLSIQLAGITGKLHNCMDKRELLVFCADNGVVEEGVSSAPQSVTLAQTINLVRGKTGAAVLAKRFGCSLRVCDVGVNAEIHEPGVIPRKIAFGTQNIAKTAAMTREQAVQAILTGAELAAKSDADVIGIGEMGIGNTTTSSAIIAVLTGAAPPAVTGRGGGITDESYAKKLSVIETAIRKNTPDPNDVVDVLAKIGGFDIAAMTGAFIGAASKRIPVVIDGLISAVAALCAVRLCPNVRHYLIPSHASFEIGYEPVMKELAMKPLFDLGMRLGEGSGCPLAMMMLDAACTIMNDMATFAQAEINDDYLAPIRAADSFTVKGD